MQYVGHLIRADGLKPDPAKVEAVQCMPPPTNKDGVRRFLGFVTYLSKFIPNLSEVDAPLRELLKSDVEFAWQPAFNKLKELCTHPPVLKYLDLTKPVEIFSDASSSGLGAVLLQDGQPVAFSSRSLTDAETRYMQIEKEIVSGAPLTTPPDQVPSTNNHQSTTAATRPEWLQELTADSILD